MPEETIEVMLLTRVTVNGTLEEVERLKYVLESLAQDPPTVDDTHQIPAALLDVVQDYVALLNRDDRGRAQVTLAAVALKPVTASVMSELELDTSSRKFDLEDYQETLTLTAPDGRRISTKK